MARGKNYDYFLHGSPTGKHTAGRNLILLCCYFRVCQQVAMEGSVGAGRKSQTKWNEKKKCLERICFAFCAVWAFVLRSIFRLDYKISFISILFANCSFVFCGPWLSYVKRKSLSQMQWFCDKYENKKYAGNLGERWELWTE